jgi:alpha-beta hydrolase superfamily lysophospholipase
MALGYEGGKRFKHAKKIQKKTEKKYGAQNVITMGHSLGGRIAEKVGKKSSQIITYNKAATPKSILKPTPKKQKDIRTSGDVVSKLATLQKHKNKMTTINSGLLNPVAAHDISLIK